MLAMVQNKWMEVIWYTSFVDEKCPLAFSDEGRKEIAEEDALWREGVELLDVLRSQVGAYAGWNGWVSHDDYASTIKGVCVCRERFLLEMADTDEERERWKKVFPYPIAD